ncbi:MAG: ABC transporter transmembrane domain-containing protein [Bacteroidota bacterium]
MLAPKKEKSKVKLTKESYKKAGQFFSYLSPYKFTFLIGWLFLVLSTATGLLFPYLLGKLLGTSGNEVSTGDSLKLLSLDNINSVVIALFIMFAFQSIFSFFRVIIFTNVTENALRDLRNDAFNRLVYMPMDFFNQNKVGELTSRLTSDIAQVQETLKTTIAELFRQIVIIVGSIVFLMFISWKLALIMIGTVPVMAIIAVFFGRYIRKLSKKAQDFTAESNSIVEEALTGIANVKSFTNELFMLNKYKKESKQIRDLNVKSGVWRGVFVSFIIFCMFGAIVFIIWRGLLMTQGSNPELNSEGFFQFMMFTIMMGASIGSFPELYASVQKAIGATENLMNIIHQKNEMELHTGTLHPAITGKISIKNLTFSYPQRSEMEVLKNINLEINANETIALVGTSGSGKTTITSLILQFYDVKNGSLSFDGVQASEIDLNYLRQKIAIVPQDVILIAGSIRENILFGNIDASDEEIIEAAKQANAWEFITSFPEGIETFVGDRGIQLSGGQKQRIAIARAILSNPTILILDEATSALDSQSEKMVQDALENLMKGRTSIVVAHRLSTIKNADKIVVMSHGEIIETGTHAELLNQNANYANLVQLQTMETID